MGIRERKERHRQTLRQQVLDVAEELFAADGYENVSMRKIADRIEYSPTTIYRLFRNKTDLMEQVLAQGYQGVRERYEAVLADPPASALEALHLIIIEYVRFALEHPNHYQLWSASGQLRLVDGHVEMRHGATTYRIYQPWWEVIDDAKRQGLLPDRDTLVLLQLIWGTVHGLISLRIHHPDFPWLPLDRHLDELLALLDHGLVQRAGGDGAAAGGDAR